MDERQMLFRDILRMKQNINREIESLEMAIVCGQVFDLNYSKKYILSEIESVFSAYEAKFR